MDFDKLTALAIVFVLVMSIAIINVRNQRDDYKRQLYEAQAHIMQLEEAAKMETEYRAKAARILEEVQNEARRYKESAQQALSVSKDWADTPLPDAVRGVFDKDTATAGDVPATSGTTGKREDSVNE